MKTAVNQVTNTYKVGNLTGTAKARAMVTILSTEVEVIKTPDNIYIEKGDIIPYRITFRNTSEVTMTKLIFIDELPKEVEIVADSIKVTNGGTSQTGDLETGLVLIGSWPPGSLVVVAFLATVVAVPGERVVNRATVEHFFTVNTPDQSFIVTPPHVTARGVYSNVQVQKSADKTTASKGDTIRFQADITNESSVIAKGIILKDLLDTRLQYVQGTLKRGEEILATTDFQAGIPIGDLGPNEVCTLTFEVVVVTQEAGTIDNQITVSYAYTKDPSSTDIPKEVVSNTVTLNIERPKKITCMCVPLCICIPCYMPPIRYVQQVSSKIVTDGYQIGVHYYDPTGVVRVYKQTYGAEGLSAYGKLIDCSVGHYTVSKGMVHVNIHLSFT